MILHNPRILHIAAERNHMIGLEKMTATTRETEDANVGGETSGRVIIESVIGSDSYSTREKEGKKKIKIKEAPCRRKKSNLTPN